MPSQTPLTDAESAVTTRSPKKWSAAALRCHTIALDISEYGDDFDAGPLLRVINTDEELDLSKGGVRGPLRLSGRGKDDFRIEAVVDLHESPRSHLHISVRGVALKRGIVAKKEWPTLEMFFDAVAAGFNNPDEASVRVLTQHVYPQDWWRGEMKLPVPLPPVSGTTGPDAELTGLEVSYKSESGTERVLLTTARDVFQVLINFYITGPIRADLFHQALQRSAKIGERLFHPSARQQNDGS